ncbi:DUF4296 domain-containing protein [Lutibacter sp. A80]|uniref:DUF4296 domain-containing protein n=1 Tax=Lutibacter sp. A80 TaxID=2918453 RepID=UPI001F0705B7|nr:DUF4296 domain-containing protein [Lutibacter sp. A80]UMB59440.1 DUF4296 domain-containing protein [Lutibacter sp. A80]
MNKFIYIFFISFLIYSCTSNTILKKPDDLIPEDKMVDLLTDLFLADNAKNTKNLQLERQVNYYPLVFEKYNIDSTQFKESNFYYTSRVDEYDVLLLKVNERLSALNKKFEELKRQEDSLVDVDKIMKNKVIDSINNIKKRTVKSIKEDIRER